ncbi:MAG: hypothetical protein ACRD21_11665 [Vicinamibacteria bacterium]
MTINAWTLRRAVPTLAGALALTASVTLGAVATEMSDPARQGDMFKRVFSYDKDLRGTEKIVVIVVGATRDDGDAVTVATVFREKGLYPAIVTSAELTDHLVATLTPQSAVMYVMPGVPYDTVKEFAEVNGFLSISGVSSLAEEGHVSVSVDVQGGKPQIVVNMPRLVSERHELSSELLNLARVIR